MGVKLGLSLRERGINRVFENRVLRTMYHGENCITMNFIAFILHQILLG
jgi:hypothetical protein